MRFNRAKVNLTLDVAIGLAFLVEAVSGFVLWLVLPHGGYQGGKNLLYGQSFILSRSAWLSMHDWFALVMVVGVLAHIVLHWRWIVCMFRKLWREASAPKPAAASEQEQCPV